MTFSLAGYKISEQLYDGPNSHVYRALRQSDDLPVVLKVLKPALPSPDRVASFRREYETLCSIPLEGAIRALSFEHDQRNWVLIQEDIGGQSLDIYLQRQTPNLTKKLRIAIQIVKVLAELHDSRVIHKDVNPSNIVWNDQTGELKLIDFGIATTLSKEHATVRHPERLEGTLAYIAPEQTGRINRNIDYRTDFYTLGATLYFLFTGRLPFTSTDPMELVHCHIAREPQPPHECSRDLPVMLSSIICKLMAKMADARYQSSFGLRSDLEDCLRRVEANEPAGSNVVLGRSDVSETFHIPQNLYGRSKEVECLLEAFDQVAGPSTDRVMMEGRVEWILVKGYSGIGKSALVHEMLAAVTSRRGYFATGKYDQLQRDTPYVAVAQAFRSLVLQLLGEQSRQLELWRSRLLEALGPNGRLMTDMVPELEHIIGDQDPVPELGPTEAQNRFNLVFQSFVRALATPSHPLVLFLDDLQWADPAGLELIELMMTDPEPGRLLLIGAYRDNEVDSAHPLMISVDSLRTTGVSVTEIHVPPLPLQDVSELVADTLHASPRVVEPLAELVLRKTEGNPLFITQLLTEVHEEGLITFDRQSGIWSWNLEGIEAHTAMSNVVELMIAKLRRQPEVTLEVLQSAACLGNLFALETLSIIVEREVAETYSALVPAIRVGLVLPASEPVLALSGTPGMPPAAREYRFLHDRVQQAAYLLLEEEDRQAVHLRTGRLLLKHTSERERTRRVFDIVDQLNHGRKLMNDPEEIAENARLNALAGRKAKLAIAYPAARDYLDIALELLPNDAWDSSYDFTRQVYRELSDAESLVGNFERAESLALQLLQHVRTDLEKARAYDLLVNQKTMLGKYEEALDLSRLGLQELGLDLPKRFQDANTAEAKVISELLAGHAIPRLIEMPISDDPDSWSSIAMKLLVSTVPAAFYIDRAAYGLVTQKAVRVSLQHGLAAHSADMYSYYGHLLCFTQGRYLEGNQFGELSLQLSDRLKNPGDKCRSCFMVANFMMAWVKHLRHTRPINDEGYQVGLTAGELLFSGYILFYKVFNSFYEGLPLERVLADVPAFLRFNRQAKNQLALDFLRAFQRGVSMITGDTSDLEVDGNGAQIDEETFVRSFEENQSLMALAYFRVVKTQALFLQRNFAQALAESERAETVLDAIAGNIAVAEHNFFASLCLTALLRRTEPEEQEPLLRRLDNFQEVMAGWVESCPENFAHMQLLVAAERARVENRHHDAVDLYEEAISNASQNGFSQNAAIANELAARAWIARGRHRIGAGFMTEALYGYRSWGARLKVQALTDELPEFQDTEHTSLIETVDSRLGKKLDLSSVLKASSAISSEIHLDKLLETLIQTVIENAGAERGVLLMHRGDEMVVAVDATMTASGRSARITTRAFDACPLAEYDAVDQRIVVYVERTGETVILGDALREGPFTQSPYVLRTRPKSVLAMLVSGQGKPLGVLYLENNLSSHAFTPQRLEVLKLLSSQVGISLENALLFREMEERVAQRTSELKQKNESLSNALQDLRIAQTQLVHSEKLASLGRLSAGIAHELKNPLNFINNFATINRHTISGLRKKLTENPSIELTDIQDDLASLQECSDLIVDSGRRADGIINSMSEHVSSTTNDRQPVAFNRLLQEFVSLTLQGLTADRLGKLIDFQGNYDPLVGDVVLNPQQISRVFVNLMSNAVDAVRQRQESAGELFEPIIRVTTRRCENTVELRIADNGPGVPESIRDRIFEPFFSTKSPGQGTGLGLAISHDMIVGVHNGTFTVEDSELGGATFVVTLPAHP